MQSNDLIDFINDTSSEIDNEYKRIQKRATEDPGTAGDQGEENWATLLRNWLPSTFHIITKGRILSHDGITSPQVDIVILKPEYPTKLLDKKLFLAGGVLAAFECKLTLKKEHLKKLFMNSIEVKNRAIKRDGTPYNELQRPILFGLLAHSHNLKKEPGKNFENEILKQDEELILNPYNMPDIMCIANLGSWISSKAPFINNHQLISSYIYFSGKTGINIPIGAMITYLLQKLAWEYQNLRSISRYFILTNLHGSGKSIQRHWDNLKFSNNLINTLKNTKIHRGGYWNEWHLF